MDTPWTIIVDAGLKSAVLCAGGLLVAEGMMRRASAARRHVVYAGVLVACLLLPVMALLLPQWRILPHWPTPVVPVPVQVSTQAVTPVIPPVSIIEVRSAIVTPIPQPAEPAWYTQLTATQWLALAWLAGVVVLLFPIVLGQIAILRIRGSARMIDGALVSSRCRMPMACGLFRPVIVLPEDAYAWPAARREAVIRHEAEHLRRRDCLWQQFGQCARALYWFNPLVWVSHHRMLCEAERACDDAVLTDGSRPSDYAEHLLAVATTGRSDLLLASAGIAMARSTSLEGRLLSILDTARSRHAVTRGLVCLCIAAILGIAAPLAMLRAQTAPPPAAAEPKPASQPIRLELRAQPAQREYPVVSVEPGAEPEFAWEFPARAKADYMGFFVAPVPRPDVQNLPQQQLWRTLNDVTQMQWFVLGMPGDTQQVQYGVTPRADGPMTIGTVKELREGFYLVMLSGYQGRFNPQEGRQPILAASCVLKVGNPKEPPKPDYSKLTAEQMQAKVQEWVEDFFTGNYRDITARKAIEWGKARKLDNGNWQIRYKYEAEIWNKDKVVQEKLFEFTPEGGFVSVQDAAAAPKVVSTEPASMAKDVPASLKEIRVVFDRPMDDKGFSFVGGGPAFPKATDKARWVDDRTCVLPVQLEPGHDYWLQINNSNFQNFRSKDGQPAVPYPIWFQTAGGKPAGPPIVAETTPMAGAMDVDPALTEIRVTFSQPMDPGGMSWVGGGENYPQTAGKPRWVDERTCIMPVRLLPNHEYRLALNSSTFMGFCGKSGVPALPSGLSFRTGAVAKSITAHDRTKADELTKEGWSLWQKQQFSPAADRFSEAVKLNPNATNAWNGMGWALLNSGRLDEARDAFSRCISLARNHPAALNGLGQVELQQGDLAQAEKHLLAAAPTSSAAWWGLAKVYLVQGKYDEAGKWTDRILKEDPSNADAKMLKTAAQEKHLPDVLGDIKAKADARP